MKPQLIIINGPNLNLLGTRQPEVYGNRTFEEYYSELKISFHNLVLIIFRVTLKVKSLTNCMKQDLVMQELF